MPKIILLIDDDPAVLEALNECLRPHYQTRLATRGRKGLELAHMEPQPDLILLDVELPDMKGYEVCAELKQDPLTEAIPVMFLSSHTDVGDITHGLGLGAVDYVTKPVAPPILLARVRTHLRLLEARDLLLDQNVHLEALVSKRTRDLEARTMELQHSQDLTIFALGSIAETRDNETGNHIYRTSAYVEVMVRRLAATSHANRSMAPLAWELIWKSAPLHDIGKVGIPDNVLLKPGKLTPEEFEVMKRHPTLGRDAIRSAEIRVKSEGSFLRVASEIAYGHHERWDGKGYPQGVGGEEIPLSARLMALADVYDALISKRVYKSAMSHAASVEIIREGRGSHFDPEVLDAFLELADEFNVIAQRFSDSTPEGA
jgi:putative two-component system response regulator